MQRTLLAFIFLFLFKISGFSQPKFAPERPKLVIGIVIDGFRYDYIQRYWNKFGEKGFKKLIYSGAFCQNHINKQLINESIVSYADISTGSYASSHGIIDKDWYNRITEKIETAAFDKKERGIGGNSDEEKYNAKKLLASTLSDELKYAENGKAKIISIAMNANAAVMLAGHSTQAYWMNNRTAEWTSAKYYCDSLPTYVRAFNQKKLADIYLDRDWTTLLPLDKYSESLPDNNEFERAFGRFHKEFPYSLNKLNNSVFPYKILTETPFGNTYTKDFAIATILDEQMGKDDIPDLLQIGFTAGEGLFNRFHPLSVETEDFYLRLDKDLAHFLQFIDDEIGNENVLIYLTSTHGMALPPDYMKTQNFDVDYFVASKKLGILKSYLKAVYGKGNWISYYNHQQLYLNRDLIRKAGYTLRNFQASVSSFLVQISGISQAVSSSGLENTNFTHGNLQYIQDSYQQKRSADIFINLSPAWCEQPYFRNEQRMYSPNSVYTYDTHIPLIWYGWKIKRKKINTTTEPIDIAPTIANFLQISWPNATQGKALNNLIIDNKTVKGRY